ncbi:MAG: XRE family transcriptional regulator [Accumulibacter sp.]|jgi:transcriptional regulator with XRE-family HTH domain|uniref:XRE family transcriptional regulator n=1 Tax=Accumulibacter sp. TaxID=2053492 RepID=UPI002FC34259
MALGKNIRRHRTAQGLTLEQLSERSGVDVGTISALENRDSVRSRYASAIARGLGMSVEELEHDGPIAAADPTAMAMRHAPTEPGDNRLPVRRVRFKISAGISGYEIEYEDGESEPIFMARRWFDQHGYRPDRLLAIKVTGRSMEPSLYDGDLVIVNLDDTRLQDGQVFAANYEGELVIKRLKRDAQQWFLSSDSPDKIRFGDKRCTDGCGLIGRVVYKQSEHI